MTTSDIPAEKHWRRFPDVIGFDEAGLTETSQPGHVVLVVEESQSKDLYSCISRNHGKTWTAPKKTGMTGQNPKVLKLKSGAIACAYTDRYSPDPNDRGPRVCLSRDDGVTWNADRVIVLKDDNARKDGQSITNLLQFSDGTLFACGWATKSGSGDGAQVGYAVAFRFTEDFTTPVRITAAETSE